MVSVALCLPIYGWAMGTTYPTTGQTTAETEQFGFDNTDETDIGTVSIPITIYDEKKANKAISQAQLEAFYMLLFRGIPGTAHSTPMLGTNEELWFDQCGPYLHALLDENNGRYPSFVVGSTVLEKGKDKSMDKKRYYVVQVTINTRALALDLENHNVKQRFGF